MQAGQYPEAVEQCRVVLKRISEDGIGTIALSQALRKARQQGEIPDLLPRLALLREQVTQEERERYRYEGSIVRTPAGGTGHCAPSVSWFVVGCRPRRLRIRAADHGRRSPRSRTFAPPRAQHPSHAQAHRICGDFPLTPAVTNRPHPAPAVNLGNQAPSTVKVRTLRVESAPEPFHGGRSGRGRQPVQTLVFEPDGNLSFGLDGQPVLGMGEGGPLPAPGWPWRSHAVQFDRRGQWTRWSPGGRPTCTGRAIPRPSARHRGSGLFVATPWVQVDLWRDDRGLFIPRKPPSGSESPRPGTTSARTPARASTPSARSCRASPTSLFFDAPDPQGDAGLRRHHRPRGHPLRWALGYMQSHRPLEDDAQMLGIIDSFRAKNIPLDALIYLGTGSAPGLDTTQPLFDFNPEVDKRYRKQSLAEMHARDVKVAVPSSRGQGRAPTLQVDPGRPGETPDASHVQNYWTALRLVAAAWMASGLTRDSFDLFDASSAISSTTKGPSDHAERAAVDLHADGCPGRSRRSGQE